MKTPKLDPRDKRVVNRLRRASNLSDWLISTGLFTLIAQWALGYNLVVTEAFDLSDITGSLRKILDATLPFLRREWPGIILALALYFWFWSYRTHTNAEMDILDGLYPEGQSPANWDKVTNKRFIHVLAVGIVTVFMLLAALLHHPTLFALIMVALSCQDIFGNEILRDNLRRIFAEFRCDLPEDDPRCALHAGRQVAARHYWLDRPQLLRIAVMMSATVLVLALTQLPASFPAQLAEIGLTGDRTRIIATLALAAIILGNELVMRNWRRVRDEELLTVEIAFDEAQSARAAAEKSAAGDLPATGGGDAVPPTA